MSCGKSACRSLFFTSKNPIPGGEYPNVKGASVERPSPAIQFSIHARERLVLRRGVNSTPLCADATTCFKIGSFRRFNNAGDVLSRVNYSCGGGNMVNGANRPKLYLSSSSRGGVPNKCDNTTIEPATCNVKYVYDSSDFIRFKHLVAVNGGYGGLGTKGGNYSSGGDNHNGSQEAMRSKRFF